MYWDNLVKIDEQVNGNGSKWTASFGLARSTCVSFGHPLALICVRGLRMTCGDFGRAQIRTQADASFSPFRHSTQVDKSSRHFYVREIWWLYSTCAELAFRLATHLRWLALTLVELKFVRKSTHVFHRLATQRKSIKTDHKWSSLYAWNFTILFDLREGFQAHLRFHLAAHRKSVRKSVFCKLASTYIDLRVHLASGLTQPN